MSEGGRFISIRTRLMLGSAFLIGLVVLAVVLVWAQTDRQLLLRQKRAQARSFAVTLANASMNEVDDENWNQVRINLDLVRKANKEFIYVLISDSRQQHKIGAAMPPDLQEQFFPDIVPPAVTRRALSKRRGIVTSETVLLRNVEWPKGVIRGRRGERIVEVAVPFIAAGGYKLGTLRVGISLREVDRAVGAAITKALLVGALGLFIGLVGAFWVARRLTEPVRRLRATASRIADGDLESRAEVQSKDEIGALAVAFNRMTVALQRIVDRLRMTIDSFERFVPRKFLAVIAIEKEVADIEVGVAQKHVVTILFSDIRGYTTMSQSQSPDATFAFLNNYLARMGKVISDKGGFIDKYIGDAIMALFDAAHTDGALEAALGMRKTLATFNAERETRGEPAVDCGIGIHRGEVVMGTIGFTSRIEATAIGDPVNVASRVEGLCKTTEEPILVTGTVIDALAERDRFVTRVVDEAAQIRGKDQAIALHALDGVRTPSLRALDLGVVPQKAGSRRGGTGSFRK